ncbi:hypothetical protein H0H93_002532 [Arthromyces matolae]|nr:hypothetical protein H0H93_002532 [Arthromyces matolae]
MSWFYSSKNLTLAALDCLVNNDHGPKSPWSTNDNCIEGSVKIPLPPPSGTSFKSEKHAPTMQINFFHRNLVEAFKSGVQDYASKKFHWQSLRQFWKPSDHEPEQRVYGEAYTSDEWLDLEGTIDPVEGFLETPLSGPFICGLEAFLNIFEERSTVSLPIILRISLRSRIFEQLVKDTYTKTFGISPSAAVLTHLRRELIQAVWKHLLTPEFKEIYKNGIVLKCGDGIWRCLYPRFFTYSADASGPSGQLRTPQSEAIRGVAFLARSMATDLKNNQPELGITDRDVECVEIAGLCHDLGHGPWSHVWDGQFISRALPGSSWKHEHASVMMFGAMVNDNEIPLVPKDDVFIKALVSGDPSQRSPDEFDIVANKRNGLDVDNGDRSTNSIAHGYTYTSCTDTNADDPSDVLES